MCSLVGCGTYALIVEEHIGAGGFTVQHDPSGQCQLPGGFAGFQGNLHHLLVFDIECDLLFAKPLFEKPECMSATGHIVKGGGADGFNGGISTPADIYIAFI